VRSNEPLRAFAAREMDESGGAAEQPATEAQFGAVDINVM
jgi:hypothetical protein